MVLVKQGSGSRVNPVHTDVRVDDSRVVLDLVSHNHEHSISTTAIVHILDDNAIVTASSSRVENAFVLSPVKAIEPVVYDKRVVELDGGSDLTIALLALHRVSVAKRGLGFTRQEHAHLVLVTHMTRAKFACVELLGGQKFVRVRSVRGNCGDRLASLELGIVLLAKEHLSHIVVADRCASVRVDVVKDCLSVTLAALCGSAVGKTDVVVSLQQGSNIHQFLTLYLSLDSLFGGGVERIFHLLLHLGNLIHTSHNSLGSIQDCLRVGLTEFDEVVAVELFTGLTDEFRASVECLACISLKDVSKFSALGKCLVIEHLEVLLLLLLAFLDSLDTLFCFDTLSRISLFHLDASGFLVLERTKHFSVLVVQLRRAFRVYNLEARCVCKDVTLRCLFGIHIRDLEVSAEVAVGVVEVEIVTSRKVAPHRRHQVHTLIENCGGLASGNLGNRLVEICGTITLSHTKPLVHHISTLITKAVTTSQRRKQGRLLTGEVGASLACVAQVFIERLVVSVSITLPEVSDGLVSPERVASGVDNLLVETLHRE